MSEIPFPVFLDSNTPFFSNKEIFFFCNSSWTVNGERGMGGGEVVSQPLFCHLLCSVVMLRSEQNHTALMSTQHYIFLFFIIHEMEMASPLAIFSY